MSLGDNVKSVWVEIEDWLRAHAPDRARELRPGAEPDAIRGLEATIGRRLPGDYAASLAIHDGNADLSDYSYLSIEGVTETWTRLREREHGDAFAGRAIDNPDSGMIQPKWWHSGWLPFAKDSGGNLLCLDLDPGPNGKFGQVLRFERSMGPGPADLSSFLEWLVEYREGVRSGKLQVDVDGFIRERT
jgi:uncharacterized protein